jgi:hypothetical protein
MEYLADAISSNGPALASPFSELVMIATVCGRALVHHYQALVESNYNNSIRNFHDRHQWIHSTLIQRLDILAGNTPSMTEINNPVTLFSRMLGQTTILYLHHTLELSAYDFDMIEFASVIEYDEIALRAAKEMVSLTKMFSQLNSFKVGIPYPLSVSLETGCEIAHSHRSIRLLRSPSPSARTSSAPTATRPQPSTQNCKKFSKHCKTSRSSTAWAARSLLY